MRKLLLTSLLLVCFMGFGQNGINYKAIIKDGGGTILSNDVVQVQFTILVGALSLYSETHSPTTDSNGIIVVNIGEGTPISGTFGAIDWSIMNTFFLNVKINSGGGFIDMGTTAFKTVPFALHATTATTAETATNVTGLEALDEGNGSGWRLKGVDPDDYGNIGRNAVDLSTSLFGSTTNGASGDYATAMGRYVTASGYASTAMGWNTVASNHYSTAMGLDTEALGVASTTMGKNSTATGDFSTAMGYASASSGDYSTAMGYASASSGDYSTAMGFITSAPSFVETVIGTYNTTYTPISQTGWNSSDRLFVVGNGTHAGNRRDALVINKSGKVFINSAANGLQIDDAGNNGIEIADAGNNGIEIDDAGESGIFISSSTSNGIQVVDSGDNGVYISSPISDGIQVVDAGYDGIFIDNPVNYGIEIDDAGNSGIRINRPGSDGLRVEASIDDGVQIVQAGDNGVEVSFAFGYAGFFNGLTSGVYTRSTENSNADLILGGMSNSAAGDNGIISSDPAYAGSDIFLRSNDAVVVQLDFDNNEAGEFEIYNGAGDEVFEVTESGNVRVNGTIVHSSDRRLKKDIEVLPYGLNEILQLQPKAYNWKDRTQENKSLGLLAQDVQTIIKEIVTVKDDEQKTLGVSYTELIPVLINAVKEQQHIINDRTSRIEELEAKLLEKIEDMSSINKRLSSIEGMLSN